MFKSSMIISGQGGSVELLYGQEKVSLLLIFVTRPHFTSVMQINNLELEIFQTLFAKTFSFSGIKKKLFKVQIATRERFQSTELQHQSQALKTTRMLWRN